MFNIVLIVQSLSVDGRDYDVFHASLTLGVFVASPVRSSLVL